jgi:hypothetical protein
VIPTSNQDGRQAKNRKKGYQIKKKSSPLKLLSQSQDRKSTRLGYKPFPTFDCVVGGKLFSIFDCVFRKEQNLFLVVLGRVTNPSLLLVAVGKGTKLFNKK